MKPIREWGPGDYWKAGGLILATALAITALYVAAKHPPEANPRLDRLEKLADESAAHEAHDDSLQLFNLCREAKTALDIPERVAVAECLERYPSLLDIWELAPDLRSIQREAEMDTTP